MEMKTKKIKALAIKSGKMDYGDFFCYEGQVYDGEKIIIAYDGKSDLFEGDGVHYEMQDESMSYGTTQHLMSEEFFNEYFKELKE